MFTTRQEVEAHLQTIRPQALKVAVETRESITLTEEICTDRARSQIQNLRRTTLDMIRSAKRQERAWRTALAAGLYD